MKQESKQANITVFYSYASTDKQWRDQLAMHLSQLKRNGLVKEWHDQQILAGSDRTQAIDQAILSAQVILLLISADFLASDVQYHGEMKQALERHERGEACVIPIIVRPCDWQDSPFAHLQCLPRNTKPITTWTNPDKAFTAIAKELRRVIAQQQFPTSQLSNASPDQVRSGKGSTPHSRARASITVGVLVLLILAGIVGVALHQSQLNACNAAGTQAATSTQDPTATSIPPSTLIRLIHRYASVNRYFDGFPTFEQADYGHGVVYNAVLLKLGGPYVHQDVPLSQLDGTSDLSDIASSWRAIHHYASVNRYFDGFPTFEQADYGHGVVYNAVLLKLGGPYIHQDVPRSQLHGTPDLSDIASSWRAIHRYASANGYSTGFPTFEQVGCGQGVVYGAILFKPSPFIELRDVPVKSLLSLE